MIHIDRIILVIIALAMIIGVIEGMITVKKVDDNQESILQNQQSIIENQQLLKETLKLHDVNPGALVEEDEGHTQDHVH